MTEELHTIEAKVRTSTGKGACRKLRKAGLIPANLIGKGKSTLLEMNPKLLYKAYKAGRKFQLSLDGSVRTVLVKELHVEPIKRLPLHVDLMYVD